MLLRFSMIFFVSLCCLVLFNSRKANALQVTYPTSADKFISVSKGPSISLEAPASIVQVKVSQDTSYIRINILDASFHTGFDSNAPTSPAGGETTYQVCGSNADGSKNGNNCHIYNSPKTPDLPIQIKENSAPASYANNLSFPVDANGYRNIYVLAQINVSGLNGFRVQAEGFKDPGFTQPTGYTRVGFGATQTTGYNMSLVRLPLNGSTEVSPSFDLRFKNPCGSGDRFNLNWYDADRPPSSTPRDPNIYFVLYNETTGQSVTSDQLAFFSKQSGDVFLGGNNVARSVVIANSSLLRVQSGDKYLWQWNRVRGNNGVQFALPYSEADVDIQCNTPPTSSFTANCSTITINAADDNFIPAGPNWVLRSNGRDIASGRGNQTIATPAALLNGVANSLTLLTYDVNSQGNNINSGTQSAAQALFCARFELNPSTSIQLLPDNEQPDTVNYGGGATKTTGPIPVKGITVSRTYFYKRSGAPAKEIQLSPAPTGLSNQTLGSALFTTDLARSLTGLTLNTGDCVGQSVTVSPGAGYVDANGNIVIREADRIAKDCPPIVNKPYVSFFGGDVLTCKDIDTYYNATKKVGSGAEYMVQAQSSVSQFISASLRGGNTSPKFLTLANTGGSVYGGSFNDSSCNVPRDYFTVGKPDDATANLTGTIVAPQANTPQSILYKPAPGFNSVKLNGFKIPNGSRTAIYVDGDLEINGNITYEQASDVPWASVDAIPALHVYVRGNIYINSKVDKLTGFFVAQAKNSNGGIIYTCANGRSPVTTAILNTCGTQLTVRGAFSSRRTVFLRSTNSLRNGTQAENFANSKAAERFIMGPEMYFTGPDTTSSGGGGGTPSFQSESTLPPLL